MIVYLLLLVSVMAWYFVKQRLDNVKLRKQDVRSLYVTFVSVMLIIVAGLRGQDIGVDLWNYKNSFTWRRELTYLEVIQSINLDYGYWIFEHFVSTVFKDFQIFLIIISIICTIPVAKMISKYSEETWLSFVTYICLGFYTFGFSSIRQALAIAFVIYAYYEWHNDKKVYALIIWIIACMFHMTAVIALPMFFVRMIRVNNLSVMLMAGGAVLLYVFRQPIFSIAMRIFKRPYAGTASGGKLYYLFLLGLIILGLLYKEYFLNKGANKDFFLFMLIALIITPFAWYNPTLIRISYYYSIYSIIYIPNMVRAIPIRKERYLLSIILITIMVLFFFLNVLPAGKLTSYTFM